MPMNRTPTSSKQSEINNFSKNCATALANDGSSIALVKRQALAEEAFMSQWGKH